MELQNKGAQFRIEWKIKNFDDFPREKGQLLSSPIFDIDILYNTQWVLHLYPDGDNDGNGTHTALYLVRKLDDDYPDDIVLDCRLSFLTPEKETDPVSWKTINHVFRKGGRCGSQEFMERGRLLYYLDNNTLTVSCLITLNDANTFRSSGCVAISIIGTEIRAFEWIIEDFEDLKPGDKRVVSIKSASKGAQSMTMTLSLTDDDILMVDIYPVDGKRIRRAFCSLDTGKDAKRVHCGGNRAKFKEIKAEQKWSFGLEYTKEELLDKLINNSLRLECFIIFYLGVELERIENTYFQPLASDAAPEIPAPCQIM
ncbi:hypothetical protein HNY73_018550 [Argiope bruennichi]|uniref:MATH domain-containing protein n=1 Tax=Argiope bruennichi TaxID=94029 RepID=A0A8T0EDL3_ARGBR|nr:hypothetical protein HNY73_018550 [Argiope bruennichi]